MRSLRRLAILLSAATPVAVSAQSLGTPLSEAALRTRLYSYAADSMRGRLAGSPDNMKATAYVADELRKIGLTPMGDGGTFFQDVPLQRTVLDSGLVVSLGGRALQPYVDYLPRDLGTPRAFAGLPVVYGGAWPDTATLLSDDAAAGKVVVVGLRPNGGTVLRAWMMQHFAQAAAICVINLDALDPATRSQLSQSGITLAGAAPAPVVPTYFHVTDAVGAEILGGPVALAATGKVGAMLGGGIRFKAVRAPARNVVAVLRGSDPALRGEYVAIGAHNDHIGVGAPEDADSLRAFNLELRRKQLANQGRVTREIVESIHVNMDSVRRAHPAARMDSIYNGADDDGSGTVGLIEIARAFAAAKQRPKRSILFVSHTGEELGLFGSQWYTDHPTVPRDSVVAQLNIDMIGRGGPGEEPGGGPDYLQLIGSRRLSTELGDLVEQVNSEKKFFWKFDYQYDANGHPEQYYCRSDHYMYARYGIPIVFASTGGHADYHQVTDGPEFIDYVKLAKVSRFIHDVAWRVADLDHRVVVDRPKPDPRGQCVQ